MISDPNWLYSSIAQSSAAIVAIIGGFLPGLAFLIGYIFSGLMGSTSGSVPVR